MLLIATIPWIALLAALPFVLRRRPGLGGRGPTPASAPLVTIVVPTRNDATRVGICVSTLLASDYPRYEVVVVDHGSEDGTREILAALAERTPTRLRLVEAGPRPPGWSWRAWSCSLGARAARGELLLFTEPGTTHGAELLGRAVAAMEAAGADLLSVFPRLTMEGFWERLLLPHMWLVLTARFPSAVLVNRSRSPGNAVAMQQFLLFRRAAYHRIGGHGAATGSLPQDVALARAVVRAGLRLHVVHGEEFLETRMFRTFAGISRGWSRGVLPVAQTTVAPWASAFAPWLAAATPLALFVLPPFALLAALVPGAWRGALPWALVATGLSLLFWAVVYTYHRVRLAYALAFPLGALATAALFVRGILARERGT